MWLQFLEVFNGKFSTQNYILPVRFSEKSRFKGLKVSRNQGLDNLGIKVSQFWGFKESSFRVFKISGFQGI
jgi:hypothetical protein